MIGRVFLQQHAGLDIILGSPIFTNKDLVFFVNKADFYKLEVPFGKPLVNMYSYITH
jgi:hypothetical protein